MGNDNKNPKLIIKNGIYLFTRYILVMFIAFYTTRLALQVLGEVDYGINNIVGGLISMFAIVSMPITGTLQRFFNVEFAKGEIDGNTVFNTSVRIILYLILVMLVLYESIGLYLVNFVLKYPESRRFAVNVIFQFTAVMTLFSFANIPFTALLYAKEKMGVPATAEFSFSLYKLGYLIALPFIEADSLILYSLLLMLGIFGQFLFYLVYCRRHFEEAIFHKRYHKGLGKDILKFSGWNSIEAIAGLSITYLSNIIINIFGGVLYNTAYGLAQSLNSAVTSFTTSIVKAVEPQITSSTVLNDDNYRDKLLLTTVKFSFIGVGFIFIIFIFDGYAFLSLWLGKVPDYTYPFCLVMLGSALFSSMILPIRSAILASGRIQKYFTIYGIISIVSLLLMYFLLKMGFPIVYAVMMVALCQFLAFILAVISFCRICSFSYKYILQTLRLALYSLLITLFAYGLIHHYVLGNLWGSFVSIIASTVILLISVYMCSCTLEEKNAIKMIISKIKNRL